MAFSYVQYTGNGATTNYAFSFPYLSQSHIKVRVDGVITSFTFLNASTVTISPAPVNGAVIDIRRETPKDSVPVDFTDGSVLLESDLDLLASFNLYTAQEASDGVEDAITRDSTGVWDADNRRIKNVATPVNANDAVNKNWAETAMSSQLASATTQATNAANSATSASASATSASGSATTATTKASEASASASAAATSASNAATSATNAATSATSAGNSASNAASSASAAAASQAAVSADAASASASASSATSSASAASGSATSAAGSATNAANSATAAAGSASSAATSATNAQNSATSAAGSANTATTQAGIATTQAGNASSSAVDSANSATASANSATAAANSASAALVSETNSAASAVSAASSAASAAAALDNFDDRYLGAKASDPALDNDGDPLVTGALYFNTTDGVMKIYTSSGWIAASSASVATLAVFEFVATGGQTTFTGTDANGQTLSYVAPALIVTLNGVRLRPGDDYTASNGTSIVLVSAAAAGDELVVDAFGNFLVANTYTIAQADALLDNKQAASPVLTSVVDHGMQFRNRIINGDMRIDQRNAGASVTTSNSYPVDRFLSFNNTDGAFSAQQDSSAPAGFVNSVKITTTTADATLTTTQQLSFQQRIEGTNVADFAWGTASAKTVTLSFWVRSSLTGTFGGALQNNAQDRTYPFTYSISVADTWEQKSVTIAGDTTGTWLTTTGIGIRLFFGLGAGPDRSGTAGAWNANNNASATGAVSVIGTLNATWYVTGVQLEVGSVATPFERRPYGTELALCQRYYYRLKATAANQPFSTGYNTSTTVVSHVTWFPVEMRIAPSALEQSGTASDYAVRYIQSVTACSSVPSFTNASVVCAEGTLTVASGLTTGQGSIGRFNNVAGYLGWSAEL